ncbi:MAG: 50S ribosomal protein L21 [Acidimicrobiia bacterium]|nr:50S ribosomal protein L21 [bacterium]MXX02011.1 50S ribosomal protein L21 [Acidimicrobiia bacterium]MXX46188.1 50S ribosomal protein L21 [Acidimicrobiia bacterium]MXY74810.1 50S ribosomal protein L21 [Acidimicrobiia bacterium]MYA38687.1 50S ribosomal protein L21 [Acidimicrobiia bacterium]
MYAVIATGGKQARVAPGDVISVERLSRELDDVSFDPVMVVDEDGKVLAGAALAGARVTARLLGEVKGPKIRIFKYKSKTGYRRRIGHRQKYTQIEILNIDLPTDSEKES